MPSLTSVPPVGGPVVVSPARASGTVQVSHRWVPVATELNTAPSTAPVLGFQWFTSTFLGVFGVEGVLCHVLEGGVSGTQCDDVACARRPFGTLGEGAEVATGTEAERSGGAGEDTAIGAGVGVGLEEEGESPLAVGAVGIEATRTTLSVLLQMVVSFAAMVSV